MALYPEKRRRGERLNGLALCAGFGGLELGLGLAEPEYRTVCIVEREAAAAATLVARMADQALHDAPIWDDVKTFDGRPWRDQVDIITGGYPCQPFSMSGRRAGADDPRHVWPDIARIIEEIDPRWCLFENVEGHLSLGCADVITSLQALGYSVKAGLFTAYETGASQQRARLFILAHADRFDEREQSRYRAATGHASFQDAQRLDRQADGSDGSSQGVDATMVVDARNDDDAGAFNLFCPGPADLRGWRNFLNAHPGHEPAISRKTHGVAERVDRYRAAGNGVCSLAAARAWCTLRADFEADWARRSND